MIGLKEIDKIKLERFLLCETNESKTHHIFEQEIRNGNATPSTEPRCGAKNRTAVVSKNQTYLDTKEMRAHAAKFANEEEKKNVCGRCVSTLYNNKKLPQ